MIKIVQFEKLQKIILKKDNSEDKFMQPTVQCVCFHGLCANHKFHHLNAEGKRQNKFKLEKINKFLNKYQIVGTFHVND